MLNIRVFLKSKINLAIKMIATFIFVLVSSLLIYKLFIYPLNGDKASSLASMFGFAATLFAPLAAFILINNWKEQVKHEKALECLATAFSEINSIHFTMHHLKKTNKPEEIKKKFTAMTTEDFLIYTNEVLLEYEYINDKISEHYTKLTTVLYQFSLITEKEEPSFEYILNSYFRIQWLLPHVINQYLQFLVTAKKINNNLETFNDHELFQVREMQLQFNRDPEKQKNIDGNYIFLTTLNLAEIKEYSSNILKSVRKNI